MEQDTKSKALDKLINGGAFGVMLLIFGWWFTTRIAEPAMDAFAHYLQKQIEISEGNSKTLESVDRTLKSQQSWFDRQK